VEGGAEGLDLLEQVVGEFLAGAHRHGRDVVDRLVGVQLDALAAGVASVSMTWALISSRPSSNTWNRPTGPAPTMTASVSMGPSWLRAVSATSALAWVPWRSAQRISWSSLSLRSFHSSASGSAALRLVMLGHLRDRSALSLMKASWSLGHVFLGQDGVHRAFGDADRAVDALVGVDDEEVRAFAEAVDGADIDAVGVLAADARFEDDVGHGLGLGGKSDRTGHDGKPRHPVGARRRHPIKPAFYGAGLPDA
jgi:hypothetical protein